MRFHCSGLVGVFCAVFLSWGCKASSDDYASGNPDSGAKTSESGTTTADSAGTGTWKAPAYATTPLSGKIAGRAFTYVTGMAQTDSGHPENIIYQLFGFTPEAVTTKCWTQPDPATPEAAHRSVYFVVPKQSATFTWGDGKVIAEILTVSLFSKMNGTPHTFATDQAQVTINNYSDSATEITGSVVIEGDADNTVNGAFTAKRCEL